METLFSVLFSSNESQRSEAYNLLLCCKHHHPTLLFIKLIFLLRYSPNMETRVNSARVLWFVKVQNLWPKLPVRARVNVKPQFLECFRTEPYMPVLRILSGIVGVLMGEVYKGEDQWEELLDVLVSSLSSEVDKTQEAALLVFANMPNDCRKLICEALSPRMENLHTKLLGVLASPNAGVKVAAIGAVIRLLYLFLKSLGVDCLNNLIMGVIIGAYDMFKDKNEECTQKGIRELINLVMEEAQILKSHNLHNLVFLCA